MPNFVTSFRNSHGANPIFERMNGWYLPARNKIICVGHVPNKTKPCLYLLNDTTKEMEILATFKSREAATTTRMILKELGEGLAEGKLK